MFNFRSVKAQLLATLAFAGVVLSVSAQAVAPTDPEYEGLTAKQKQEIIWSNIESTTYETLPEWTGREPLGVLAIALNPIRDMVRKHFNVTLERFSDVLPEGRGKPIHTYGSVAKVQFIADKNSPYTGLYQGAHYGVARLSLASKPSETSSVPGMAIKFFVDGIPSLNFVAMYSLDGQESHNFFERNFTTFVNPPKNPAIKILASGFMASTNDATKVDVSLLAKYEESGTYVGNTSRAPDSLFLVPNRAELSFADEAHEVRNDFATIPEGTTLYEVYGLRPAVVANETTRPDSIRPILIGRIVTTSPFIASSFGDQKLFFRHQRYEKSND